MKNLNEWDNSGMELDKYLGEEPCRIDEGIYLHLTEIVHPKYCTNKFAQNGECDYRDQNNDYYMTVAHINGNYWYLGKLPEFLNE